MPEPFSLSTRARVIAIKEHSRTISGRKDSLGQAVLEHVKLGWFVHLAFGGDAAIFAIGVGDEKPNLEIGDEIPVRFGQMQL